MTIAPAATPPAAAPSTRSPAAAPARPPTRPTSPASASYRLDPAPAGGYTLIGSPTVIAKFTLPGDTSQVAARLLDVAPDGQESWSPAASGVRPAGGPTKQVFQLHPNGWLFAEGHVPKLELLANDAGGRPARLLRAPLQRPAAGHRLEARAAPAGARAARVRSTAWSRRRRRRFLPEGYELAADFAAPPRPRSEGQGQAQGRRLEAQGDGASAPAGSPPATTARSWSRPAARRQARRRFKVAKGTFEAEGGKRKTVKMKLSNRARQLLPRRIAS